MSVSRGRLLRAMAAVLAVLLLAASCGGDGVGGDAEDAAVPLTVFLAVESPIYYGLYVAEELGYYDQEGVVPEFEVVDGSSAAVQQVLAGNGDLADSGVSSVVEALEEGFTELRAIYAIGYGSIFYMVVPEDSDIQTAADLEGRSIGVTDLSGGEVPIVQGIIASAGLSGGDVELVPVGEGTALTARAVEEGQVDAFGGAVNDIVALEVQGLDLRPIIPDELAALPASSLVTTEEVLNEKRDAIAGFLRATTKGFQFGQENPEAALSILMEVLPEQFTDPTGEGIFRAILPLTRAPEGVPFGTQDAETWGTFFDFIGAERPDEDLSSIVIDDFFEPGHDYDPEEVREDAETYGT